MLINYDEHIDKLNDFRNGKVKEALKLGNKELDASFRFVAGNMNFILGHNNVGKDTLHVLSYVTLFNKT